ncbi:diphthine synthase, partial [Irineochytrium annulatum]
MLFIIGLGLGDEKDVTVKGLEAIKSCERIYLEAYTSILTVPKETLEKFYGKDIVIADREMVESEADTILAGAENVNVAFLVVGDPYGATTHTDLVLRARELSIPVQSIHNASIMNAVGCCGLQLYNYGQTVSIVFFTENWRPDSFYDKIKQNRAIGLHTLCLLDIKVKEQSLENMARGRKIYEPPRYMTVSQACSQLLEIEEKRGENVYSKSTIAVGLARVGASDQMIVSGTLQELVDADLGGPLHSLVIAGTMHFLEAEIVKGFAVDKGSFESHAVTISFGDDTPAAQEPTPESSPRRIAPHHRTTSSIIGQGADDVATPTHHSHRSHHHSHHGHHPSNQSSSDHQPSRTGRRMGGAHAHKSSIVFGDDSPVVESPKTEAPTVDDTVANLIAPGPEDGSSSAGPELPGGGILAIGSPENSPKRNGRRHITPP